MRLRLRRLPSGHHQLQIPILSSNYQGRILFRFSSTGTLDDSKAGLPQPSDLLEQYRGLVALGKLKYDLEQVRVIMHLRRLQRDLVDYAPPVLQSRYLRGETQAQDSLNQKGDEGDAEDDEPWWSYGRKEETEIETRALTKVKSHVEELTELDTPKGLFLTGPPGSGKTMLINMWFASLPTPYKARKHYSQLILEIYRAVWEETQRRMAAIHTSPQSSPLNYASSEEERPRWTKGIREHWRVLVNTGSLPTSWTRYPSSRGGLSSMSAASQEPPIAFVVAKRLLLHHWLLVFDEVQLLDVSSATLLADVLSWFWRMGGVVVGNSNKVPKDLYLGGVARERLEGFVEALVGRCPVVEMGAGGEEARDWREVRARESEGRKAWFTYGEEREFEEMIEKATEESQSSAPQTDTLHVFGRPIHVPWTLGDACKFSFAELCDQSLGTADYLTITSTYRTIIITDIPILKLSSKNQARRFISLIDALYESRCNIVCFAEAEPEHLFFPEAIHPVNSSDTAGSQNSDGGVPLSGSEEEIQQEHTSMIDDVDVMMAESMSETQDGYRPNISSYAEPKMREEKLPPAAPIALETLSIFSGKDEQFAYKRALSRLLEMTSSSYAAEELWMPLPSNLRKWEGTSTLADSTESISSTIAKRGSQGAGELGERDVGDFAAEAAYSGSTSTPFKERPEAPRIREHHMWGVGGFDLPEEEGTDVKHTDSQDNKK